MTMKHLILIFLLHSLVCFSQIAPSNGLQESKAKSILITNANIYVSPTLFIENGSMLIQDQKIVQVGKIISAPKGTIEKNMEGAFIFPSFIESNSSFGQSEVKTIHSNQPQLESNKKGAYYWNESIKTELNAFESFNNNPIAGEELSKMGFGFVLSNTGDGIARGTAALITLGDIPETQRIVVPQAAQYFSFEKGASKQTYPSSQMGVIALIRQFFYDAKWYQNATDKELNFSLEAYNKTKELPYLFKLNDKWEILRAKKIADEFSMTFNYITSGNEYENLNAISGLQSHLIIPLNFPDAYDVRDPYISRQIPLSDLKHWELAPSNAHALTTKNIKFCFSSNGIKSNEQFWKNIRLSIERGLSVEQAIAALTLNPAKWMKQDHLVGSLEKGHLASFSVYSKNPFIEEAKLLENWNLGQSKVRQSAFIDITGDYNLNINGKIYPIEITGNSEKLETKIQAIQNVESNGIIKTDTLKIPGFIQLNQNDITLQYQLNDKQYKGSLNFHGKVDMKFGIFEGDVILPTGQMTTWSAIKNNKQKIEQKVLNRTKIDSLLCERIWFPNGAYGFNEQVSQSSIVYRNATLWTNEAEGIIKEGTVIVQNGKITFAGKGTYSIPNGAIEIDCKGKHLTSGIIDEHSHIAISKGVNEGGQSVSAEVSIGDVINPDDINIYRQLSGGVTAAQLLHGSANPIGGQSALIKLKWGFPASDFLIPNAPKFIKCALGENVKQSNWGDRQTVRFPQSRMGVEQVFYDAFTRAKAYEKLKNSGVAYRTDLELETVLEIINSQRFITCHSYVQSEINMLMHIADSMGFKINTFTHILEGYKVADKMKAHGAGASTFADWWAYKYEVNDAIPQNAKMMQDQGIIVAINSDDAEMGRRLNQEAAKSIKYSGMNEIDAWKMVTLNPAKLLHLDDRMGSLKVGKDADIVLWSDNPLSIQAKVEMTVVDGYILYEKHRDEQMRYLNQEEKARIISKMLETNKNGEPTQNFIKKGKKHFHCNTLGEEGTEEENHH